MATFRTPDTGRRLAAYTYCLVFSALVLLFWFTCPQTSALLDHDLTYVHSEYECVNEGPDNVVCSFKNLVLHQAELYYIHKGEKLLEMPDIKVEWFHNVHLQLTVIDRSKDAKGSTSLIAQVANQQLAPVQVSVIPQAVLVHRQWHLNYYHSMTESLFEVFNLACTYLHLCHTGHTSLTPVFIDMPGRSPWAGSEGSWHSVLPPAAHALECFFPRPAMWVGDPALHDQVFIIQKAVVGIGPYNRKWPSVFDTLARFKSVYRPANTTVGHMYRQGLLKCLDIQFPHRQIRQLVKVLILNRDYKSGRHMVNADEVAAKIKAVQGVKDCRVISAEQQSLKQQAQMMSEADVVIMTHGAAMGNIMFMAPGSVIILYNWVDRQDIPFTWVTAMIQDLGLPVNFVGLSNKDRRHLFPRKEDYVHQQQWSRLSVQAKVNLLERGECPPGGGLQDCSDLHLNFALDWSLLEPAIMSALELVFTDAYKTQVFDTTV